MRTRAPLTAIAALFVLTACSTGASDDSAAQDPSPSPAEIDPVEISLVESEVGTALADAEGRVLYGFTKDKDAESVCEADCIATWPALTTAGDVEPGEGLDASLLGTTERTDGVTQVTYGEWPLYYYVGDVLPEESNGQGLDGEWSLVAADGTLVKDVP
ncbi:hypothetical protein PWG71_11395 [Nocardiopsis sp. N85]|uniref:COG4315 family predicted lipoprotein n=1 Tax=Nocardiopsis sp. N85 TaxID=3029400 RepID=UPI00237FCA00|nr:hypothetical protein [Nocardiopsis sp. N85]MDE3721995.1 hypothetical protein [Nocardiopsis sp. N85]